MAVLLILLVLFIVSWFVAMPPPFWIICVILEAIALVLLVQPYAIPLLR